MINFIDLRDQAPLLEGGRFAFWDTTTSSFVSDDDGTHTWATLQEFQECLSDPILVKRCCRLAPDWTTRSY